MNGLSIIVVALGLVLTVFGQDESSYYESEDRIVGGTVASDHSRPWAVTFRVKDAETFFCAGTVIDAQWVLTAAHCVMNYKNNTITAVAGTHQLCVTIKRQTRVDLGEGAQERLVSEIYANDFNNETFKKDIALLKLDKPFIIGKNVSVASLPTNAFSGKEGDLLEASGWGRTEPKSDVSRTCNLKTISIPYVQRSKCQQVYAEVDDDSFLCAGERNATKATCHGDSGGPLVKLQGKSATIYGVTNFNSDDCDSYSVFAKVSHYLPWIRKIMDKKWT